MKKLGSVYCIIDKRKPLTEEVKMKISESNKGHIPWNKGLKTKPNKNEY